MDRAALRVAVWVAQRTTAPRTRSGYIEGSSRPATGESGHLEPLAPKRPRRRASLSRRASSICPGLDYGLSYAHLAGLTEFYRRLVVAGQVPDGTARLPPRRLMTTGRG